MSKLSLTDLTSLANETSVVNVINANNALIEAALEKTLSRDGTSPNTLTANIDMNGYRLYNQLDSNTGMVSAKDYGAIGDGSEHPLSDYYDTLEEAQDVFPHATDLTQELDWAAIQMALNTASSDGEAAFISGGTYIINSSIQVPSNTFLYGPGKLKASDDMEDPILRIADKDNVFIAVAEVDGNKASAPTAILGGISVLGDNNSNITISGVYVHDCAQHGIYLRGDVSAENISVVGCRSEDNDLGGITSSQELWHLRIINNHVKGNGTHGIGILGIAHFVTIAGNTAVDNGPSSDNFTGYAYQNSDITIVGNTSLNALNHGFHFGGNRVVYSGNIARGTSVGNGIRHSNNTSAIDNDVVIIGNVVTDNASIAGIWIERVKGGVVSGNTSSDHNTSGIYVNGGEDLSITGNTCRGNTLSGIEIDDLLGGVVSGNTCLQNVQRGIIFEACDDVVVSNNTCRDNTLDGIRVISSGNRFVFSNNICRANGASGIRVDQMDYVKVIGNQCTGNINSGFTAGTGSTEIELINNDFTSNTVSAIAVTSSIETHCTRVEGNKGYNPVGVSSITVGASPYTYTAGPTTETVYITGGTVSNIKLGATSVSTGSNRSIELLPFQSVTVIYSGLPTMIKSIH